MFRRKLVAYNDIHRHAPAIGIQEPSYWPTAAMGSKSLLCERNEPNRRTRELNLYASSSWLLHGSSPSPATIRCSTANAISSAANSFMIGANCHVQNSPSGLFSQRVVKIAATTPSVERF